MVKKGGSPGGTTNEPFAWAISADNKSVVGADADGYFQMTVMSPDRIEMCYSHTGLSPTRSIVATCYVMERAKKVGPQSRDPKPHPKSLGKSHVWRNAP